MSEWIPCSEKLPEKDGEYLVTARLQGKKEVSIDHFQFGCQWDDYDNNGGKVLAWMPLPEPLEVEEDDKSCWNCKYKSNGFSDDPCYECFRRLTDDGWEEEE